MSNISYLEKLVAELKNSTIDPKCDSERKKNVFILHQHGLDVGIWHLLPR